MTAGPRHELATAAEIRALFERTKAIYDGLPDATWKRNFNRYYDERRRTVQLLGESYRFCAVAAGALRDPDLGDVVLGVIEQLRRFDDYPEPTGTCARQALQTLLAAGLPVDAKVRGLARSDSMSVRLTVAQGLAPRGPAERELLRVLAADPAPSVRKAARASLASAGEIPWWLGKWDSDPAARLLPEEAERGGAAIRRVSELLDLSPRELLRSKDNERIPELVARLRELPDALAVEPLERFWRSLDDHDETVAFPLLLLLLQRDGGIDAFLRVIEAWGDREHAILRQMTIEPCLRAAPMEVRRALAPRLLAWLAESPTTEAWEESRRMAAAFVSASWPPDADITPVLDEVLRLGEGEGPDSVDRVRASLAETFKRSGVDPAPVLDRICEARLAGYPGPWSDIGHDIDPLLRRAPAEVLRRTAELALHQDDAATIRWGATLLLGDMFDEEKDGEPLDRARAFMMEPRLRAAMVEDQSLTDRGIAFLRAELRAGALTYPEAVETFGAIRRLYGGLAEGRRTTRFELPQTPEQKEEELRAAREAVAPFLGPAELHGPPTEGEWLALAKARAAYDPPSAEKAVELWARALTAGPWTAEEQQDFEGYLALLRAGDGEVGYPLASAIIRKPTEELVLRLDEIIPLAVQRARPLLKHWRRDLRATFGLPPVPRRRRAAAGSPPDDAEDLPAGAWNDADDDDADDDE